MEDHLKWALGVVTLVFSAIAGLTWRRADSAYAKVTTLELKNVYNERDIDEGKQRITFIEAGHTRISNKLDRMDNNIKIQTRVMQRMEKYVLNKQKQGLPTILDDLTDMEDLEDKE